MAAAAGQVHFLSMLVFMSCCPESLLTPTIGDWGVCGDRRNVWCRISLYREFGEQSLRSLIFISENQSGRSATLCLVNAATDPAAVC